MRKIAIVALSVVAAMTMVAAPASAGGREVREQGSCSAASDWKLKVKADDGGLELEFEVDQNVTGDTWRVRVLQDGDRIFTGRRQTRGPSGSLEISLRPVNTSGGDRFVAKARNPATDEVCRGTATF